MPLIFRKALIVTAMSVALFALWIVLLNDWGDSVAPGGDTLAECLVKMPDPVRIDVFEQNGQEYLLLWGEYKARPHVPSGAPQYVFDRTGKLVDWTSDSGSGAWWQQWPGLANKRQITRDELMRWPGAAK